MKERKEEGREERREEGRERGREREGKRNGRRKGESYSANRKFFRMISLISNDGRGRRRGW